DERGRAHAAQGVLPAPERRALPVALHIAVGTSGRVVLVRGVDRDASRAIDPRREARRVARARGGLRGLHADSPGRDAARSYTRSIRSPNRSGLNARTRRRPRSDAPWSAAGSRAASRSRPARARTSP